MQTQFSIKTLIFTVFFWKNSPWINRLQ